MFFALLLAFSLKNQISLLIHFSLFKVFIQVTAQESCFNLIMEIQMYQLDFYFFPFQYSHNYYHFMIANLIQIVSLLEHQQILIFYEKLASCYSFLPINYYRVLSFQMFFLVLRFVSLELLVSKYLDLKLPSNLDYFHVFNSFILLRFLVFLVFFH